MWTYSNGRIQNEYVWFFLILVVLCKSFAQRQMVDGWPLSLNITYDIIDGLALCMMGINLEAACT